MNSKKEIVKDEFSFFNTAKPIVEIDFNLSNPELIKSIESQLNGNTCDYFSFTGKIKVKNKTILFPIYLYNQCDFTATFRNVIDIVINKNDNVLIENEILSNKESIINKLVNLTSEMNNHSSNPTIIYDINWDSELNPVAVTNRFHQVLKSIKTYNEEISKKEFNKELSSLDNSELILLNQMFNGVINFSYKIETPPKPSLQ